MLAQNNHPTVRLENAFQAEAITWQQALHAATEKIGHHVRGQRFEVFVTIMHSVAQGESMWYIQFITENGETHFAVVSPDGSVITS